MEQIVTKLTSVFDSIDSTETIMSAFYAARQEQDETVAMFGCSLEGILYKAQKKKIVAKSDVNSMLRQRFWSGLKPRLRDISRHTFETTPTFEELQNKIRLIEVEHTVDCSPPKKNYFKGSCDFYKEWK